MINMTINVVIGALSFYYGARGVGSSIDSFDFVGESVRGLAHAIYNFFPLRKKRAITYKTQTRRAETREVHKCK